jgi:hypothetical protein
MVELFDYEGREWFNVGTGCLLFAIVALTQLFWCMAGNQASLWNYMAVYFCGFALVGLALITKRTLTSLLAAIVAMFFVINDIWSFSQLQVISVAQIELIRTATAVIAFVALFLGVSDFLFEWTKIDVDVGNYPVITAFSLMLVWVFLRLYGNLTFESMGHGTLAITALALNILLIPFLIVSILAMLRESGVKVIDIDDTTLNNIAFLFAALAFLVILFRWSAGGLMQLFG